MPVYVYHCPACGAEFETLRPSSLRDEPARCEACGQESAVRSAASFAAALGSGGRRDSSSSCGGGGGFT